MLIVNESNLTAFDLILLLILRKIIPSGNILSLHPRETHNIETVYPMSTQPVNSMRKSSLKSDSGNNDFAMCTSSPLEILSHSIQSALIQSIQILAHTRNNEPLMMNAICVRIALNH